MSAHEGDPPRFSHLDEALTAFEEALRLIDKDEQPASYGVVLHDIAQTYEVAAEYGVAVDRYRESAVFKRQAGNHADIATTLVALAGCLIESGPLSEASSVLDEAKELLDLAKPRLGSSSFAFRVHEIGVLYERLGRAGLAGAHDAALHAYRSALENIDTGTDPVSCAVILRDIGDVHLAAGRLSESASSYARAAALYRDSGRREELVSVLIDLGRVNRRLAEADGEKFLDDEALRRAAAHDPTAGDPAADEPAEADRRSDDAMAAAGPQDRDGDHPRPVSIE